jgi:hypothetical protein
VVGAALEAAKQAVEVEAGPTAGQAHRHPLLLAPTPALARCFLCITATHTVP